MQPWIQLGRKAVSSARGDLVVAGGWLGLEMQTQSRFQLALLT
jgi:hypothetical protein